jgi:uncharacterized protein YaaW (UPF0174 family)
MAAGFSLVNLGAMMTQAGFINSGAKNVTAASITPVVAIATTTASLATAQASSSVVRKKSAAVKTAVVKKTVKKTTKSSTKSTTKKTKTLSSSTGGVTWSASALKMMSRMASFDYSYTIRRATMTKIANYAKQHHIKVITASVINSCQE